MADINDLANLMESVDVSIKEQTGILRSILLLQTKEALTAQRRWEISRADRDVVPPTPPAPSDSRDRGRDGDRQNSSENNTLSGLLGGLAALFGGGLLKRFAVLAGGATALAASIALTIGVIQGQMIAIKTFFKAFAPGLIKLFDDFKSNLSTRLASIRTGLLKSFDDFRVNLSAKFASITAGFVKLFDNFAGTMKGMFSSGGGSSNLPKVFAAIQASLKTLIEPFSEALKTIRGLSGSSGSPSRIATIFGQISGWLGDLGSQIGKIASVVGKIFAPIAIVMTIFDTIKGAIAGYAEGGILGAFEGAITGFFTSLIAAPLDLLKNVVSWVAGAFGFDRVAEVLDSFSFAELFKQIIGSLFNGVSSAVSVVTDLFTFGEEDMTLFGALGKLTDLVYAPVNMAINFVRGMFGFEETEEPFKLQDWISEQFNSIIDSIKEMFSFIPSITELGDMVFNALPTWMQDLFGEETRRGSLPRSNYTNPADEFAGYATGTRGFVDFGSGTRATLHGLEAVVPRNTEAGKFLEKNFDDSWRMKLNTLENTNQRSTQPIVINAPNNSQTNLSSSGGSMSTIINSFGGSSSLDAMSRPGGVY
jgi:hypothetical protein